MTNKDLAKIYSRIYCVGGKWDIHYDGSTTRGLVVGIVRVENMDIVSIRGSKILLDWILDADAVMVSESRLGGIHPGFNIGVPELWAALQRDTKGPWIILGHSKGAGCGSQLVAYMTLDGKPPKYICWWGSPKAGDARLSNITKGIPGPSYRNQNTLNDIVDRVTTLPWTIPPLEPYVHDRDMTVLKVSPTGDIISQFGMFAEHHFNLYENATPDDRIIL